MINYYDTQNALTEEQVYKECLKIYIETNGDEDKVIDYLAELASTVYSCPDKCDMWACDELLKLTAPLYPKEKPIEQTSVTMYPCSSQADDTELTIDDEYWIKYIGV